MRVNQEDRPGVSNFPPSDVEKQVKNLSKRKLKDVLSAIPPIKNSTYNPLQIEPSDSVVNPSLGLEDLSPFNLFSLFSASASNFYY